MAPPPSFSRCSGAASSRHLPSPPARGLAPQPALAAGDDLLVLDAVVEAVAGVADVAEAVPLAGGLRPEAVQVVVAGDAAAFLQDVVLEGAAAVHRRVGPVEAQVEGEHRALPYQLRGLRRLLGGNQVEAAQLDIVSEQPPAGALRAGPP